MLLQHNRPPTPLLSTFSFQLLSQSFPFVDTLLLCLGTFKTLLCSFGCLYDSRKLHFKPVTTKTSRLLFVFCWNLKVFFNYIYIENNKSKIRRPLLAPTGALIVIVCYCISSRGHFLRFWALLLSISANICNLWQSMAPLLAVAVADAVAVAVAVSFPFVGAYLRSFSGNFFLWFTS